MSVTTEVGQRGRGGPRAAPYPQRNSGRLNQELYRKHKHNHEWYSYISKARIHYPPPELANLHVFIKPKTSGNTIQALLLTSA